MCLPQGSLEGEEPEEPPSDDGEHLPSSTYVCMYLAVRGRGSVVFLVLYVLLIAGDVGW